MIGDNPYTDIFGAKQFNSSTFQKIHDRVEIGQKENAPDFIIMDYHTYLNEMYKFFQEFQV